MSAAAVPLAAQGKFEHAHSSQQVGPDVVVASTLALEQRYPRPHLAAFELPDAVSSALTQAMPDHSLRSRSWRLNSD